MNKACRWPILAFLLCEHVWWQPFQNKWPSKVQHMDGLFPNRCGPCLKFQDFFVSITRESTGNPCGLLTQLLAFCQCCTTLSEAHQNIQQAIIQVSSGQKGLVQEDAIVLHSRVKHSSQVRLGVVLVFWGDQLQMFPMLANNSIPFLLSVEVLSNIFYMKVTNCSFIFGFLPRIIEKRAEWELVLCC